MNISLNGWGMSLRFEKNTLLRGTDSNVKSLTSEEILELSGVK